LRSNGFAVLLVGLLNHGQKRAQIKPSDSPLPLNTKTTLLHEIETIGSHQNHPKSFMGCIESICDD
jgi:hypothetical protein